MRWIVKLQAPSCLETLRTNSASYDDLRGDCREVVVRQLREETRGLCAYCERSLHQAIFIEHYLSQAQHPGLALVYSNLLAVCSGKIYLNRATGQHIRCCDTAKGDQEVTVDPRSETQMATLYYDENGKLRANSSKLQNDIDQVLHLNFDEVCLHRMAAYDEFEQIMRELKQIYPNRDVLLKKALASLERNPPEYSSYVKYNLLKHFKPSTS